MYMLTKQCIASNLEVKPEANTQRGTTENDYLMRNIRVSHRPHLDDWQYRIETLL